MRETAHCSNERLKAHHVQLKAYRAGRKSKTNLFERVEHANGRASMGAKNSIAKHRQAKGIVQRDLAREADVPRGVLSMMESGLYFADMDKLAAVAKVLDCGVEDLYPRDILSAVYGYGEEAPRRREKTTVLVRIGRPLAAELDALIDREIVGSRDEGARLCIRLGLRALLPEDPSEREEKET